MDNSQVDLELGEPENCGADLEAAGLKLENSEADIESAETDIEFTEIDAEPTEVDLEIAEVDLEIAEVDLEIAEVGVEPAEVDLEDAAADLEPVEVDVEPAEVEVEAAEPEDDAPQRGDILEGTIVSMGADGAVVDLGLDRPGVVSIHDLDQLDPARREALQEGGSTFVYLVDVDREKDHITLSVHQAVQNEKWLEAERLKDNREIWMGKVLGYNQRGLVVPFGNLRGFVPISHMMSIPRRANPAQVRERLGNHVGQVLPLRVIEVDRRRRRLILSHRAAYSEWRELQREKFLDGLREGEERTGRVRELKDFGAFVDLGGGDGLIHISEFAWHRINHPKEMLRVGQEVQVRVLKVNRKRRRVGLSLKRLTPHPWETLLERYQENQVVEGRVTRVADFGAFVEIEPGIEGLLHAKHLHRSAESDPQPDPHKVVREGEVHLLRIISIDTEQRRIRLSMRAVTVEEQMEWMVHKAEVDAAKLAAQDVIGLAELIGEEE